MGPATYGIMLTKEQGRDARLPPLGSTTNHLQAGGRVSIRKAPSAQPSGGHLSTGGGEPSPSVGQPRASRACYRITNVLSLLSWVCPTPKLGMPPTAVVCWAEPGLGCWAGEGAAHREGLALWASSKDPHAVGEAEPPPSQAHLREVGGGAGPQELALICNDIGHVLSALGLHGHVSEGACQPHGLPQQQLRILNLGGYV